MTVQNSLPVDDDFMIEVFTLFLSSSFVAESDFVFVVVFSLCF